ncbi:HEAT repeat-containing protein 6 [Kappamyces sp. JEL0680]|nr:HEAT repeat-containing protein 6 [Kappamyces sp. JEL0680]
MHSQWSKFLPSSADVKKSLMYLLLHHTSDQVRAATCRALVAFFTDSKQYLSIAAHGNRQSSFTSLSQLLANQLFVTIELLIKAFKWQTNNTIITELFAVLNVILKNCALKNLHGNLAHSLFTLLYDRIPRSGNAVLSNDPEARHLHLTLDCLSSLLEHIELNQSLYHAKCLGIILDNAAATDPALETANFNLIAALASHAPELVWAHWTQVYPILQKGFESTFIPVNLSSLKALEHFAHASLDTSEVTLDVNWWKSALECTAHLWMLDSYAVRCVSCHLFGHIGCTISGSMEPRLRALVITTILAYSQDVHHDVRAASCGTLGNLLGHLCIHSDPKVIHDIACRLPALCDDTNLKVRIRAFWALGSLADALQIDKRADNLMLSTLSLSDGVSLDNLSQYPVSKDSRLAKAPKDADARLAESIASKNSTLAAFSPQESDSMPSLAVTLDDDVALSLLRASIAGCSDHEKVRSHAFRALGRMAPLVSGHVLRQNIPLLAQGVHQLVSNLNSGAFKTRWNACHCLRHLLAYDGLPLGTGVPYTSQLYKALVDVSAASQNFKVKTGALMALSTPEPLEKYGSPELSPAQTILQILKGLKATALSIEKSLVRAPIDEQKHLHQFLDAFYNLLEHLNRVVGESGWIAEMQMAEIEIGKILERVGKQASSFDPNG